MSKNLKNCLKQLKFVAQIKDPDSQLKALEKISNRCIFKALREICINVIHMENKFKGRSNRKIFSKISKKYGRLIRSFARRSRHSKVHKNKLILQSGGFLQAVIPLLGSLLPLIFK